jgi:hypothetical protein
MPGKGVSASLSRRPKTPAIVLRTASGRNFDVTPSRRLSGGASPPADAEGEEALGTAGKMPALQSNRER